MSSWKLTASKLNRKSPVPSDIQIVRDHQPKKITLLAKEIGLSEDDYSPYGHYVAKGKMLIHRHHFIEFVPKLRYPKISTLALEANMW